MFISNYPTRILLAVVSVGLLAALMLISFPAAAIKKCQDSEGKWYYGDLAEAECRRSKITTLDDRGFIKEERPAPKTQAELAAEAESTRLAEAALAQRESEAAERARILSIYETEADIERQRANQLTSIESDIGVHEAYLNAVRARVEREKTKLETTKNKRRIDELEASLAAAKSNIDQYQTQLDELKAERLAVNEKFDQEIALYRELKAKPDTSPAGVDPR